MATRRVYEFLGLQLDPAQRRIEKQGEAVTLNAKAFDALVYLVEHAGEPVSRRALAEALWPKRVVEENNLTQAISALRRAVGDECIVTLAGRGYQFVADVRSVEVNPSAVVATAPERSNSDGALATVAAPAFDPATLPVTRPLLTRSVLLVAASAAIAALLATWAYFSASRTEVAAAAATDGEPVKVLVLPFETPPSRTPEQQAFADGLTHELIGRLQALPGLSVGRETSFALRDSPRTVPEIAAEFGVQYVFRGRVDTDGDRLRARAELSDATGFSVWSESFDRRAGSIFDVQDEIVAAIAQELRAPIGLAVAPPRGTEDAEAYNLYLAARADAFSNDSQRALDLLDRALERDGKFAAAWSMKARVLIVLSRSLPADEREAQRRLAQDAADKAVSLGPNDGRSHIARASVLAVQGDWFGAEDAFEKAFDLGFSDLSDWPVFLMSAGRIARARERFQQRFDDEPLFEGVLAFLMLSLELSGQPTAADDLYEQGRLLHGSWAFGGSASTWIRLGREGESVSLADVREPYLQFLEPTLEPEDRRVRLQLAATQAEYSTPMTKGYLAVLAAGFNDTRLASTLLEEAVTGDALLTYLAWLPVFAEVRQTPEFKGLLEKIGLVQYWRGTSWPDVCRPVGETDFVCD